VHFGVGRFRDRRCFATALPASSTAPSRRFSSLGVPVICLNTGSSLKSLGLRRRPRRFSRQPIHRHPPDSSIPAFFQTALCTLYTSLSGPTDGAAGMGTSPVPASCCHVVLPSRMPGSVLTPQSTHNQF